MRTHEPSPKVAESDPSAVVRVRFDIFDALCNQRGLTNDLQRAKALKISHPHLSRIRAGHVGAGSKVIASALALFGCRYEDLFERRSA